MDSLKSLAHWLLRAGLAAVFFYHGLTKFPMAPQIAMMLKMSLPAVYALATAETLAGFLIVYGGLKAWAGTFSTRLAGFIMAAIMLGAITLVHWPQWGFMASPEKPMGGMEFQVILLVLSLYFLIRGNEV